MTPKPITLHGRHVRLEPLTLTHAPDLLSVLAEDPSIWQWMSIAPPLTLREMEAYIAGALAEQAAGGSIPFAQVSAAEHRTVGSTRYLLHTGGNVGLEIGWTWLGRKWQRTAINTEAKYLLLRHAFEDLGAPRVQLKTDARNLQSQAAIERLGALREGVLRKFQHSQNGFIRDSVMFSIIGDEWPAVKARLEARLGI